MPVRAQLATVSALLLAAVLASGCTASSAVSADSDTVPAMATAPMDSATPSPDTPSQVDAAVRAFAPHAHYGVFDAADASCRQLHGWGAAIAAPIASAFKLWILDALAREIADGRASWDEVLPVRDDLRSDPSGQVYAMPAGTALTVRQYAELMISISDNTAADHLLARLGRQTVEAAMVSVRVSTATRNTPLLSTADMTRLKFVSPEAGERYLALETADERRRYLDRLPAEVPFPWTGAGAAPPDLDLDRPRRIAELEWFASPADLCRTMVDLASLAGRPGLDAVADILALNPGVPPDIENHWEQIRFKGGSEPGVLALVYWLTRPDGPRRVAVLAVSDPNRLIAESPAGETALRALLGLAYHL